MDRRNLNQNVDILVFGAHPDDIELSCSGTILKHIDLGYKVGLIDLTRGELGTRGSKKYKRSRNQNSYIFNECFFSN